MTKFITQLELVRGKSKMKKYADYKVNIDYLFDMQL